MLNQALELSSEVNVTLELNTKNSQTSNISNKLIYNRALVLGGVFPEVMKRQNVFDNESRTLNS